MECVNSTLSKEARRLNRERLEDLSEQPTSFGDTEEFAGCKELYKMFMETFAGLVVCLVLVQ